MRKRIFIIYIVALAVCLLLLVFKTTQRQRTTLSEQTDVTANQPQKQLEKPKAVKAPNIASIPNAGNVLPVQPGEINRSNEISQQMQGDWQKPIEFYGKVMDENSNAVEGATIKFRWADMTETANTSTSKSDAEGLFSLHGKSGRSLHVWVAKEGFYASHGGEESFLYSLGNDIYSPDPVNPVVFLLRKRGKGEPLIRTVFPVGMGQIAQLRRDGTPIELDLLKGAQVPFGNGQLKLEFWRDISNTNANIFDWKFQMSAPGGGLVETPEEFAFRAPENGYQSSTMISMSSTNRPWKGEIRSKYYVQLPDGKYGRIDFYLLPYNGVFEVNSTINPSGSRNLEPQ